MKKIILISIFSATALFSFGQATDNFFGLRTWQTNGYHFSINGTSSSDSLFSQYESYLKLFKGLLPGAYTTSTLPSGMPAGTLVINADSITVFKIAMYNGTAWGYVGGGTGAGSVTPTIQQVITQGNLLTKSDTIALAGYNWDFYTGARGRNLLINASDSFVHFQNFGAEFEPDSLNESTNASYFWYGKTPSLNPLNVDYSIGRYIAPQSGQASTEDVTAGYNLLPSGVARVSGKAGWGTYQQYNLYSGSAYHNVYSVRAITTGGTTVDMFKLDHAIGTNVYTGSSSVSTYNFLNPNNPTSAYSAYAIVTQNQFSLQGSSPNLGFEDTAYTGYQSSIHQVAKDLAITAGRNLSLSAGANGMTFTAGYIYMNSPLNAFNVASPTAQLQIGASSGASQTAPFKFTLLHSKPLTTPEKGAFETDSLGRLMMTDSTGHRDTVAMRSWVEANFGYTASGRYLPILSDPGGSGANYSSASADSATYSKIGNVVTVFGLLSVTPANGSASTHVNFSLPISSTIANTYDLHGTGSGFQGSSTFVIDAAGNATTSGGQLGFLSVNTSTHSIYYTFQYIID